MVDIDKGFLDRSLRIATREGLSLDYRCGDFLDVALSEQKRFDVAIFQSSFHHCLEFEALVDAIKSCVLKDNGVILFVNEPISHDLQFPWGLRYDGESLWAIMCNQWLELGFHHDFFVEMLMHRGFLPTKIDGIHSLLGDGWKAIRGEIGVSFRDLVLPSQLDSTFHAPDSGISGRFCQARSVLPRLRTESLSGYNLTFINYGQKRLSFNLKGSHQNKEFYLDSGDSQTIMFSAFESEVTIESDTFIPNQQVGNGDNRILGINLDRISLSPHSM